MYNSPFPSPSHTNQSFVKMPGITGTTRTGTYKTTIGLTSLPSSTTTTLLKTPSMQRKTYTNCTSYSTTSRTRPLPTGPGPLTSDGRNKLPSDFSLRSRSRAPSLTRNGPLRVDYNSESTKSYLNNYDTTSHKGSSNNYTSGLHGRRSGSLYNLSSSNLDYERTDRFDRLNNNSPTTRPSYDYGSLSRSSSRSKLYSDYSDTDTGGKSYSSSSKYVLKRRSSFATKDEFTHGTGTSSYEKSPEPRVTVTATYKPDYSSVRRTSLRENGITSPSRRIHEADEGAMSEQNLNNNLNQMSLANRHARGKTGLRNLGNTCFMNSILQSLSNTKPLLEYCMTEDYRGELNNSSSNMKGALFIGYAGLMKSLWNEGSDSYVSPNNFKTQIQRFAPRFMGYQQQDAQEFLRYLLEGLHEDVNRVTTKHKHCVPNEEEEDRLSDSEKAKEFWRRYLTVDNSKIVDMFVGQLKSELKFDDCRHKSVTFDPFWDLSVPIPKGKSCVTLQDCISLFMKEEELDDEERPTCSKCKDRRSCKKSFSIQKFPKILVLHLKRFSQEMYRRKLTILVEFPVTGLDLTAFSAETGGPKILYNLYAVCNHSGGTHSGHYTAHCKHPYSDEWNYFNDSRVTRANGQNAVSAEAYVLFYELSNQSARL